MKRLFATDLDGTILPHNGTFHIDDLKSLIRMGEEGIIRVVATGRSLFFSFRVLPDDFPIDYLVFSSGAGVYNWRTKKIIRSLHLNRTQVCNVENFFANKGLGYTLHKYIPENHQFWYKKALNPHPDLNRFVENRSDFATPISALNETEENFSQLLTILDEPMEAEQILSDLKEVKVIRATSPIDGKSIWIEVFHQEASKASGIQLICGIEMINHQNVWVLGNDYNDVDMLNQFYPRAFVVNNAPDELKVRYNVVPSVSDAGMSVLAKEILEQPVI